LLTRVKEEYTQYPFSTYLTVPYREYFSRVSPESVCLKNLTELEKIIKNNDLIELECWKKKENHNEL
jgi:hypothetical protein